MKVSYSKWLQVTAALLIGLIIGSYSVFSITSSFFLEEYYTSLVAELTMDVTVLRKLRKNDIKTAVALLESRIDVNIVSLDVPETKIAKQTYSSVLKVLRMASEYRREFDVKNRRDETDKLVSEILARSMKSSEKQNSISE